MDHTTDRRAFSSVRPRKTPAEWSNFRVTDDDSDTEKAKGKDEKLSMEQFMRDCYAKADDETKRAMIKSFTESNGTVLNMNWNDVGSRKIEPKPPAGVESKQGDVSPSP